MKPAGPEEEVICPSCGRYVGTFGRCPYCRAKVPMRLSFQMLKWGGLAVAVLGVLFLYLDLHGPRFVVKELPILAISDISPAMNFAQVYLHDEATFVKYDEETRFLGIFLTDENGNDIFVRAYDGETRRLIEMEKRRLAENDPQPKYPAVGDILKVRGNLRVRPGFSMMILQFAEGLTIERPEAIRVTIENIVENAGRFNEYQRLEVQRKVINIESRNWAVNLTLHELETEAEISVLIPKVNFMFGAEYEDETKIIRFGEFYEIGIGSTINVKGAFSMYYEQPQLWLASWHVPNDIEVIS